ncbi:MAG: Bax inhibitor-1/YccA family protein [Clostridiaceae bacterium]|jgi:FtsH-binding integral membrane protein|nr:Bax inhibitor-1/YccA family protein [Clostridiaceae bacterium]
MQQYSNEYSSYQSDVEVQQGLNAYISKVFMWMFIGLAVTAFVAFTISNSYSIMVFLINNTLLFFGLLIGELILVSVLSRRIMKMQFQVAFGMFLLYAVLNGVTFSIIMIAYAAETIWSTFLITSVTFGIMALYGRFTRTDLTQFRSILFMGLIGVAILSLVNIFLKSSPLGWIISIVGLFVFLGLTAYDTQKLKDYYYSTDGQIELRKNLGVLGALALYLDFINLFLMLLRLFGRRK